MSHLPVSLMNRQSAVSNFGCRISKGSPVQIIHIETDKGPGFFYLLLVIFSHEVTKLFFYFLHALAV